MPELYSELIKLAESDMYPFHMPGHKRNSISTPLEGAFRCDITEIDGFDNLHEESGIILQAEERANRLYGADKTFFLVNGSTCGVLAAVSAAVKKGGTILAARGSHKSFYHAAYLRDLNIEYLPNKMDTSMHIPDRYCAEDIEKAIEQSGSSSIEAVFITSPTYEGKCSDIRGIADVCHRHNILLIVDAAHGAHFGFGKNGANIPENAVRQNADIVIHSVHKTLPSMTQTALLHIKGNMADRDRVKRFLRIYQSSSPSYVLMSSIDLCMKEMEENGDRFIQRLLENREKLQLKTAKCRYIKVLGQRDYEDAAKAVISVKDSPMTGQQLYDILREEYALQLEMAGEKYALAIISGWDSEEGIDRLIKAICSIDERLCSQAVSGRCADEKQDIRMEYKLPKRRQKLSDAWDMEKETEELSLAEGRICGEFVGLYPPGIPLIVPGEEITAELIGLIKNYVEENLNVQGISKEGIICVKQK